MFIIPGLKLENCVVTDGPLVGTNLLLHETYDNTIKSDATVIGTPAFGNGLVSANALLMGGASAPTITYPTQYFNPQKGTLAFWLQSTDFDPATEGGGFYYFRFRPYVEFWQNENGKGLKMQRSYPETGLYELPTLDFPLVQGGWYHITLTWLYDSLKYYLNGQLKLTKGMCLPLASGTQLEIAGGDGTHHCLLNDLRVWKYPLDDADILTLCNSGVNPVVPAERATVVSALLYPSLNKAYVDVDISNLDLTPIGATADIYVTRPGLFTTFLDTLAFGGQSTISALLDLPDDLQSGHINIQAQIKNASETVVASRNSTGLQYKNYVWRGTKAGVSDEVISPYTALTYDTPNRKITCWGREYWLKPDGLPDHVVSRGATITAPITLTGTINGNSVGLAGTLIFDSQADGKGTFHSSIAITGATILVNGTIEYDGYLYYTITVTPTSGDITISNLQLNIPINLANAPLYHAIRYWARAGEAGYLPAGTGKIWDSLVNKVGADNWQPGSFLPYWWIGDYDRGLCWMADNDENWSVDDADYAVEFDRDASHVTAVIHFVKVPVTVTQASPWVVKFGIMAGPPKPEIPGWRALSYDTRPAWWNYPLDDSTWGDVSNSFEGYPYPPRLPQFMGYAAAHLPGGVNLTPHDYWGSPFNDTPENLDCALEWLGGAPVDYGLIAKTHTDCQMYYLDMLMAHNPRLVDGIYSDDTFTTIEWNPLNGAAYVRPDGTRRPGYSMAGLRDYFKRSAWLFRHYGCTKTMHLHMTGSYPMPCYSFWDSKRDHEDPQNYKATGLDWIDVTPLGVICARSMSRQYGQGAYWNTQGNATTSGNDGDDLLTLCFLHDILGDTTNYVARTSNPLASFGIGQSDVEFLGYWGLQAGGGSTGSGPAVKDIKISAWVRPNGTALVTIGNLTGSDYTGDFILPLSALGVVDTAKVCDGETGTGTPKTYTVLATGATVHLTVLRHNCRILLLGPNGTFN